jgi:MATE family multidrug resistance protein
LLQEQDGVVEKKEDGWGYRGAGDVEAAGAEVLLPPVPQKLTIWQEVRRQCWLAGPMVCVNLLQYSITVVSVAFVGHLGELELASASIASSLAGVLGYYVLLGMGSALETLCGQAYGAGSMHHHMLGVFLQRALVVLYGACIPISLLFIYMEHVLLWLGQEPRISEKAGEYALYLLPSLYAYALLQPVVKFLQTQSVVFPMMVCSAVTLALHVGLSYTFVYTFELGFRGAAIATSVSFWLNAILLTAYVRFSGVCTHTWKGFSTDAFVDLKEFLSLAVPSCIMICLEYWCFEILVILAGLLPNPKLELATLSVCLSTTSLNYMIPFGLSAAASTRVANELGAGDAKAAKQAVASVVCLSAAQAMVVSSILMALRHHWGWLFSGDAEVVDTVASIMPFIACVALLDGIQGVLSGVARGCGWQELGAVVNLGAFYGVGVPISVFLAFFFHFGGRGLFMGLICGLATQTLVLVYVTLRTDWEQQVQKATARIMQNEEDMLDKGDDSS